MKHLITILLLFSQAKATNYYVSNAGSDGAGGTSTGTSWATISKVNSSFGSINAGDSILFRKGDTFTGTLTPTKNGSIIIASYGTGAAPLFSGTTTVTGWTSLGGNKYQSTNVITPASALNIVTFNGVPQRISRYPDYSAANKGYLTYIKAGGSTSPGGNAWIKSSTILGFSPAGLRMNIRKKRWDIEQVTCFAYSVDTLYYAQGGTYPGVAGFGFFFENDSTFLTENGEWWLSPSTGKLIIYSIVNPATLTVKCGTTDIAINLAGRSSYTIKNISFDGYNTTTISSSFPASGNIIIDNCTFTNCGVQAIRMDNAPNSSVTNCTVNYALGAGITIHNLRSSSVDGATVNNCSVHNIAQFAGMEISGDAPGRTAITVMANNNVNAYYNTIDSAGYAGMEFQGSGVTVYGNNISNCLNVRDDGGCLYSYVSNSSTPTQYSNRIVRKNIIHDAIGAPEGTNSTSSSGRLIYFDEGSNHILADSNTLYNSDAPAFYGNSIANIFITHNNVFNAPTSWSYNRFQNGQVTTNLDITNNAFIGYVASYANVQIDNPSTTLDANLQAMGRQDSNYVTVNVAAPFSFVTETTGGVSYKSYTKTYSQWQEIGKELHTTVLPNDNWQLLVNATGTPLTSLIDGTYQDVYGNQYVGSITQQRYSSTIYKQIASDGGPVVQPGVQYFNAKLRAVFIQNN